MISSSIKAKCRRCGKDAPAEHFKLHYKYRMMVCPDCFSGKTDKQKEAMKKKENTVKLPGWDMEDDYLEKYHRQKVQKERGRFVKIPGTNQVRYNCANCKFSFRYDPFKKRPRTCPYCNTEIPRLKTFSLL